jgi:outer membrane lipoprotein-sorting protein
VSNKIPTLLYAKAQLSSDFGNFRDAAVNGSEEVDGRRCYRLAGWARDVYGGTGNEVNVRKMTVWIDADSRFIRKILEQWQPLPGQVSQKTTTFAPQANPTIDEGRFRFMPPAPR